MYKLNVKEFNVLVKGQVSIFWKLFLVNVNNINVWVACVGQTITGDENHVCSGPINMPKISYRHLEGE